MSTSKAVVVAGDVMIDWNLSVDHDKIVAVRSWADAGKVVQAHQFGGAWLLEDLIRLLAAGTGYVVRGIARPDPLNAVVHQTYTVVTPASDGVLRVHEFLGVEENLKMDPTVIENDDSDAAVVALLDSDLRFEKTRALWPKAIVEERRRPWIVLKTSVPAFQEPLWQHLVANHADGLIVVLTVEDLRRKEIQLIRRVSWERTALDLMRELANSASLQALRRARYLVVSFGKAGAMLLPRDNDEAPQLIFDPKNMEDEWNPPSKPSGIMIGYTTILAAAVAHEAMVHPHAPQLTDALQRGVAGMRALLLSGFGTKIEDPRLDLDAIAKATLEPNRKIVSTSVVKRNAERSWTVLQDRIDRSAKNFPDGNTVNALYELAARVAVFGPGEALVDVPQLSIGKLFTVDREEIEAYRSIKALLIEYVERTPSEPLSMAVFGSPGSGKSFGVKEIVKAISSGKTIRQLTFNLTQFASADDLRGAFHQVRDVSLRGEIPLVFWDEFDTTYGDKPLGWLRYFISPMQDGEFQEDQITHPIGTSIFVFAGGTASSKDEFVAPDATHDRKALKVPDFISRLKGFLNVTGPNRRNGDGDTHSLIRRAILLRSMLERHCPKLFREEGGHKILRIAPGVLYGILNAETYVHGARSLESVIAMSTLAGRNRFVSSSLPPEAQLALHVEPSFQLGEHTLAVDVERLEQQAKLAHDVFQAIKKKHHWSYAEIRDDSKGLHNLLVDYDKLPEHEKEANRSTVRMIPKKLEGSDYAIAPAGTAGACEMSDPEIEHLAELEHTLWVERKTNAGYQLGPEATESPKRSPYLVHWKDLDVQFQDIDRAMIAAIPKILAIVEQVLVRAHP